MSKKTSMSSSFVKNNVLDENTVLKLKELGFVPLGTTGFYVKKYGKKGQLSVYKNGTIEPSCVRTNKEAADDIALLIDWNPDLWCQQGFEPKGLLDAYFIKKEDGWTLDFARGHFFWVSSGGILLTKTQAAAFLSLGFGFYAVNRLGQRVSFKEKKEEQR